jgi:copper chaperone CopZ
MNIRTSVLASSLLIAASLLGACAGGGGGASADKPVENAVVHTATPAESARLKETAPVASEHVRLYVNGMGCPLCVTNIDRQLERLPSVKSTKVNLSDGTVDLELYTKNRPSPAQLAKAVNGDFTLIKIEELK